MTPILQLFRENEVLLSYLSNDKILTEALNNEEPIEKNVINLINKIAGDIFSRADKKKKISYIEIKNVVVEKIISKAKTLGLIESGFDYNAVENLSILEVIGKKLINLEEKFVLEQSVVSIDLTTVKKWMSLYKNALGELQRQKAVYENVLKRGAKPLVEKKLTEINRKIIAYENTINNIEHGESSPDQKVPVLYPPVDDLAVLKKQATILGIQSSHVDPSNLFEVNTIKELYNSWVKFTVSLERKVIAATKQVFIVNDVRSLMIILKNHDARMQAIIAGQILHNMMESIKVRSIKVPLDEDTKKIINVFLSVYDNLDTNNKSNVLMSDMLAEVKKKVQVLNLRKLLKDSEVVLNYQLMHSKKNTLSANKILTLGEDRLLKLFDALTIKKVSITNEELKFVAMMLEKSLGNKAFNKKLEKFSKQNNAGKEYSFAIKDLKYFSFKTAYNSAFPALIEKAKKAIKAVEAGKSLEGKDQISLFEYGRLDDIAKLKSSFDQLNEMGVIARSKKLTTLYNVVNDAHELIAKTQNLFAAESVFKDGDILTTESKLSLVAKNKSADLETYLTQNLVSKYSHVMQVYIDPETKVAKLSHIYGGYQSETVKYSSVMTADAFRINVFKLIPPALQSKLKLMYAVQGKDPILEINKLFQQNMQRLHVESQQRFVRIENDKALRFKSGLADYFGGHTRTDKTDRKKVRDAMYETNGCSIRNRMICSEFVARTTIAALFETNEMLIKELNDKDKSNSIKQVIAMPLSKEKLQRIHPERLVRLLWKEGCLEQVDKPAIVRALINFDKTAKTTLKKKKADSNSAEILFGTLTKLSKSHSENGFIKRGLVAIRKYSFAENININFRSESLKKVLENDLKIIYKDLKKSPPKTYFKKFVVWLKKLGSHLGFTHSPKSSSLFIKNNLQKIEKMQYDEIKDVRYHSNHSGPKKNTTRK